MTALAILLAIALALLIVIPFIVIPFLMLVKAWHNYVMGRYR